ncbi:MAG: hypothetical protein PVH29_03730 [Candidatus Zixiibacteriota bacterium]|jgi:hypothetical protein
MPEESVADGVLARLENGEDIGDVLRDDIERREGVFFREWMRTTDGWQGIATPAGGAGTAEGAPPGRVRRDDPDLNILIYVISDIGLQRDDDESGLLAYVNLIRDTFPQAKRTERRVAMLSDKKSSDTASDTFGRDMSWVRIEASEAGLLFDQIHFIGHGLPESGVLFKGAPFNRHRIEIEGVDSLPLKPEGVIILFGCFSERGPFYEWALDMVGGDTNRVCAFRTDLEYDAWWVEEEGKSKRVTDWYEEGNESLMEIHDFIGLEKDNE